VWVPEYLAKDLVSKHGISIPKGIVVSSRDVSFEKIVSLSYPVVIKIQIPSTNRSKIGGIKIARTPQEAFQIIDTMNKSKFGEYTVDRLLIEEWIEHKDEIYLGLYVDRDNASIKLIASRYGGSGIEEIPQEGIILIDINPLIGLQRYMFRKLHMRLNLDENMTEKLDLIIKILYDLFVKLDLLLLEINPLAVTSDGSLIALDIKMIADDYSIFRQNMLKNIERVDLLPFERKMQELGITGSIIDKEGNIAVIASGAGCLMSTVDTLKMMAGKVLLAVDLGGSVFSEKIETLISEILSEVVKYDPKVILINAFFNMAGCDVLAKAVKNNVAKVRGTPIVIRLKGRYDREAREILSSVYNVYYTDSFDKACEIAVEIARSKV